MTKLKNGTEEPQPMVSVAMMSINDLWASGIPGITALSDLVQICRNDPTYKKFGTNEDTLKKLALLQANGQPHDLVRNIVLSAFTGEGLDLELGSPIAK